MTISLPAVCMQHPELSKPEQVIRMSPTNFVDLTLVSESLASARSTLDAWIGTGRTYINVPEVVSDELIARTAVSSASRTFLPHPYISIAQVLHYATPQISGGLHLVKASTCFSPVPSNTGTDYLCRREIPPHAFVCKLRDASGQAMLDGKVSIKDWTARDVYFAFEALGFWFELLELQNAKNSWSRAKRWLNTHGTIIRADQTRRSRTIIEQTPWNGHISRLGRGVSITEMADFLHPTAMLSTSHINAMLLRMRCRLVANPPHNLNGQSIIASAHFDEAICGLGGSAEAYFQSPLREARLINTAVSELHDHESLTIYSVGYSPPLHWGAFIIVISGGRVQVQWGDSLKRSPPLLLTKGLRKWAKYHFPVRTFTVGELECAGQPKNDSYSCGIAAINALQHHIFGDTLWTAKTRENLRIEEFLLIMEHCKDPSDTDPPVIPRRVPQCQPLRMSDVAESGTVNAPANSTPASAAPSSPIPPTPISSPGDPVPVTTTTSTDDKREIPLSSGRKRRSSTVGSRRGYTSPTATAPQKPLGPRKPRKRLRAGSSTSNHVTPALPLPSHVFKKATNALVAKGEFRLDAIKWGKYETKLRRLDPQCKLYPDIPTKLRHVRCSYCRKDKIMSEPYSITAFAKHLTSCRRRSAGLHVQTLSDMLVSPTAHTTTTAPILLKSPCSGITVEHEPLVGQYTQRTEVSSAGGTSVVRLAEQRFNRSYASLTDEEKQIINTTQRATHRWVLDHTNQRVFSTQCVRLLETPLDASGKLGMCTPCSKLLQLHEFRTALSKKIPDDKDRRFIPHSFQNKVIGELFAKDCGVLISLVDQSSNSSTIFRSFSRNLSQGKYDNNPVFLDLIEVMNIRADRAEAGIGLQNMKYPPALDEFCHELQCISPQAYRTFKLHFAGRSERSFKQIRSKMLRMHLHMTMTSSSCVIPQSAVELHRRSY